MVQRCTQGSNTYYDPECVEISFRPHRRRLGDQFCSLCGRFTFDAASAAAASGPRWPRLRLYLSLDAASAAAAPRERRECLCHDIAADAAPTAATPRERRQCLCVHLSLDASTAVAASRAGWNESRLAFWRDRQTSKSHRFPNGRITVFCHWCLQVGITTAAASAFYDGTARDSLLI